MSAQAAAKLAQGYQAKPVPSTCGNCAHFQCSLELPDWMALQNIEQPGKWGGRYERENDKRCGHGNFAVKKMATCLLFVPHQK